jgi:hypothetical protein
LSDGDELAGCERIQKAVVLTNAVAASDGSVTVAQLKKWGRITGHEADYAFGAADARTKGPIVVMAKVNLYRDAGGARTAWKASVAYAKKQLPKLGAKPLAIKRIGAESWAFTYETAASGLELTAHLYTWRVGTKSGALMTAGLKGRMSQQDSEALVAKQLARMRGARS